MNSKQKRITHEVLTELDDLGRKKFTLQEKEHSESEEPENNAIVEVGRHQSTLVGREEQLHIEKYIGKIEKNRKKQAKEVFYCEVCKEGFKCDLAYITHLNSPHHNRKLGMNMKVKAVSAEEVANKLKKLQEKPDKNALAKEEEILKQIKGDEKTANDSSSIKKTEDIKVQIGNEEKEKQEEEKQNKEGEEEDIEELLKQYGLPSCFGSKKKKQ